MNTYPKILYTKREAAAAMGVSAQMLMILVRRGELGCTRVGARVLFSAEELQKYVRAHTKPAMERYDG